MREKLKNNIVLKFIYNVLKIIAWAVLVLLIILAGFLIYYVIMAKKAEKSGVDYKPPMALYTIISPSMVPNINVYDVVFNVKIKNPADLKKGDIITFVSNDSYMKGMIITHRIVEKHATAQGYQFKTKGDANVEADSALVMQENIIGKVIFKVPQLGRVQFFLSSKGGWFIAILIPALAVISYDIVKLFKLLMLKRQIKQQNKDELSNIGNSPDNENVINLKDDTNNNEVINNLDTTTNVEPINPEPIKPEEVIKPIQKKPLNNVDNSKIEETNIPTVTPIDNIPKSEPTPIIESTPKINDQINNEKLEVKKESTMETAQTSKEAIQSNNDLKDIEIPNPRVEDEEKEYEAFEKSFEEKIKQLYVSEENEEQKTGVNKPINPPEEETATKKSLLDYLEENDKEK